MKAHRVALQFLLFAFASTSCVYGQLSQFINSRIYAQNNAQTYLGKASSNRYEFDSITNIYGSYGSSYSSTSIRNPYSSFGSAYATDSAYNAFANYPPILYSVTGAPQAYLTKNTFMYPRVDPDALIAYLESLGSSLAPTNAILMGGTFSYNGLGSTVTYGVDKITNYRPLGTTSGTLVIQLWATSTPYSGSGTLLGHKLIETIIGTTEGGYYYENISASGRINSIPSGNYNIVFVLAEWSGSAYLTVDYGNFNQRENIGLSVTAPTIITQPSSKTVSPGATVSFSVIASGTAPLTYQWRNNGANIFGANGSTYTIASAGVGNTGSYTVLVTNMT